MDEDTAAIQYEKKGLTKLIDYNNEQYIFELLDFMKDAKKQQQISNNFKSSNFISENNLNNKILEILR
jgi:hypothetical protein